ncbi:MAG: ABC transporter substrate-binding protein [Rhodoplanes sp.]|nr:ABC transporter substrate-binding protein [Rhodoplanes sp.]
MVALAGLTSAQAQQPAAPPEKVSLLLNWYLYSEHAPFFLGRERGYFAQEGIDLDIQEGRGSTPTVQAVAAGTVTFGYADLSSAVKAAAVGAPVVVIGVLLQKSPMAVMGLSERNIRTPQDMRGRTVALTPGDSLSQVWPLLLKKTGLSESDVKVIGGDMQTKLNAVINGQVDLMLGYLMDQNMRIENATKKPVHVIPFSDYGVNLVSSSIIASKETVTAKSDLVRRFMRAATRAVEEAEKNPEAAVDAMLKANIKAGDRDSLIRGLKLTIPLYHTAETQSLRPFRVSPESIADSLTMLSEYGGLDKTAPARARDFVILDFLPN